MRASRKISIVLLRDTRCGSLLSRWLAIGLRDGHDLFPRFRNAVMPWPTHQPPTCTCYRQQRRSGAGFWVGDRGSGGLAPCHALAISAEAWPMNFCPAGCGGLLGGWVPRRGVLRLTRSGSISPISIAISATMLSRAWPFCPANRKRICCAEPCGPTSPSFRRRPRERATSPASSRRPCAQPVAPRPIEANYPVCPVCLSQDAPYLRRGWRFSWKWSATPMAVC